MGDSKLDVWANRRWPRPVWLSVVGVIRHDPQALVDAMVADGLTFTVPELPHVHDWRIGYLGVSDDRYEARVGCQGCGERRSFYISEMLRWEGEVPE